MARAEDARLFRAVPVALSVALAAAFAVAVLLSAAEAAWAAEAALEHLPVSPNDPSSAELVEEPRRYDGVELEFVGEAIGEVLERGGMSWLHLNDDAYYRHNIEEGAPLGGYNSGMPVWLPTEEAAETRLFGDFRHEGDVVRVRGVFNAACPEHGGDMDIHADALEVVAPGRAVEDAVDGRKAIAALVLLPLAALLWWADRVMQLATPDASRLRRRAAGSG